MANLGLIGGIIGSAMAGAIGSALNKGSSSGSSSSSKGSSGSSSSASGSSSSSSGNRNSSSSSSSNRNSGSSSGSYSSSFSPSFDQNTDYQALINDAVSKGDYMSAAKYEQQRNAKINAGYGNGYNTTNYYTGYLNGSNYYGNNSSSNPYSGNRYINDYDTLAGLTMPYLDSNGNLTTKKADIGVKLDLYDQMYNLEHDDLARAQYDHWRALATGVDDLLSIPDRQLLGLPIGYTVLNDPRAFYDEVPRQERSSSSSSSSYSDDDSSYTPTTYNALGYTVPSAANTSNLNYLYSIPASQLTPEMVSSFGQSTITNPLYASGTTGTTGYGTTSGSIAPINYGNVDIGNTFWQAALNGADAEYLQSLANARLDKAGTTSGLGQYYNDQNQLAMQGYVNNLMQQEQAVSQLEAANQAAMDQFNNQYMLLQQQNDAMLNSFNQYYDQAYAQQQAAYQAAADAARQQYLQMLPDINTSYDQSARQAYINNMMAQRDLPEQLSAAGVGGQGVSESAIIAQNNAYNAAYNQNELARQQAIQDINNAAANAYANAGVQGAQAAAELYLQQANAQQNILSQQQSNRYNYLAMLADMQNNAINNQYNYLLAQNSLRNDALNNLYNYSGLTGTIGGVPTLAGQELAYNQAYNNQILAQNQQQLDNAYKMDQYNALMAAYEATGNSTYLQQALALIR